MSSFDISIEEANLDTVWYETEVFYYKSANFTITEFTGSVDKAFWESLGDDYLGTSCRLSFYANDTLGHLSSKSVLINRKSSEIPIGLILIGSIVGGGATIGVVIYLVKKRFNKKRS